VAVCFFLAYFGILYFWANFYVKFIYELKKAYIITNGCIFYFYITWKALFMILFMYSPSGHTNQTAVSA